MEFIGTCADFNLNEWNNLMKGAKPFSYKKICKMIKEQYPEMYFSLALNLYNPWCQQTKKTKTHYIMVHSATEYFFKIV